MLNPYSTRPGGVGRVHGCVQGTSGPKKALDASTVLSYGTRPFLAPSGSTGALPRGWDAELAGSSRPGGIDKMPKKKTLKAAAKRFKKTAKGKLKYAKAGSGHLLGRKTRKRKRDLRSAGVLSKAETKRVSALI